jgi:hypothetical protein
MGRKHCIQFVKGGETFVQPPPPSSPVNRPAEVFFYCSSFRSWDDVREEHCEIDIPKFIRPKVGKEFLKKIWRWQLYATDGTISDTDENMLL